MLYSAYNRKTRLWMVFASPDESPVVFTEMGRWNDPNAFVSFDALKVVLPNTNTFVEHSPIARGIAIQIEDTKPISFWVNGIALSTAVLSLLWALVKPFFDIRKTQ